MRRRYDPRPVLLVAALLTGGACETVTHEEPAHGGTRTILRAGPTGAFEVELDGERFGRVVRYDVPGWPQETRFVVQNSFGQDLGLVDALGRAYRYRPHAEPLWLGTGTVAEGAAVVLGLEGRPRLVEVALEAGPTPEGDESEDESEGEDGGTRDARPRAAGAER